ncbi:helix-turn-helix domain-containing protein [Nocardioides daejeonensis]|uniref:helix-turn-helix domain-containing protein n=1 Tax=Nocardioides daejeonensis TaxID=1046556 RepID=UPI000D74AC4A|nr:AraC family transcriptional regulator [Nocardioides daejeonensis]
MGRDRLRELLEAALGEQHDSLEAMAQEAHSSPFHFSRQIRRGAGEAPVALRRRVLLERAAWRLAGGATVTVVAHEAGYESVDGFARAFARAWGHPPSATPRHAGDLTRHWLPAPNGIHFHPPTNLWVDERRREAPGMQLTLHLVHHDLDDTRLLLRAAAELPPDRIDAVELPGMQVLGFNGPEESLAAVLTHLVHGKEVWLAALIGRDSPPLGTTTPRSLLARHEAVAEEWAALIRDIERRGAWDDQVIDALCDPPESFVLSSVVAHVLTYSAQRRLLARHLLRRQGVDVDDGDPILWLRQPPADTSQPVDTSQEGR